MDRLRNVQQVTICSSKTRKKWNSESTRCMISCQNMYLYFLTRLSQWKHPKVGNRNKNKLYELPKIQAHNIL